MDPLDRFEELLLPAVFRFAGHGSGMGRATGILGVFALVERMISHWYPAQPIKEGGVLRYQIAKLPPLTRPLPLDPPVRPGDRIVHLHFHNPALTEIWRSNPGSRETAWEVYTRTERDLHALAALAIAGRIPSTVRAVWAETTLFRPMRRLGFHTRESKRSLRRPFARLFAVALMAIFGPPGLIDRDPTRLRHYRLGEAWMNIEDLIDRYS